MNKVLFSFIFFCLSLPSLAFAENLNAGFVEGIWYSNTPIIAGETTRIYVALRNNTDHDLTGTVRFNDNGTSIGSSNVSALPGRLVEAWIDWTPGYGKHKVTATISNVRVHAIGENPELAAVSDTLSEDATFADYDTDKDGIGNELDTDDDGDGVSDVDEVARGTNPLKADPIQKKESAPKSGEREKISTTTRALPDSSTQSAALAEAGLETYIPENTAHEIVSTVTEKIGETKASLDAYRGKRADAIKEYFANSHPEPKSTIEVTPGSDATITRSKIETNGGGFLLAVVDGGKALLRGFYSLILWLLSGALSHPALLELVFLLLIVYIIYRTARRLGRRAIDR